MSHATAGMRFYQSAEISDGILVRQVLAGDKQAFEILIGFE